MLLEDERPADDQKPSAGLLILQRTHHSVPYLLAYVEQFASLLVTRGLITEDECKGVKQCALEKYRERAVEMLRVDDVEEFWDDAAFSR
jgi:hypothetical protein